MNVKFWYGTHAERDVSEIVGVDGRIILHYFINKKGEIVWTG
jgi:hypothetical protein